MSPSEPRAIDGSDPGLALASHGARLGVFSDDPRCFDGLEARLPVGCVVEARDAAARAGSFDASFWLETASRRLRTDGSPAAFRLRDEDGELETGPALAPLHDRLVSELHFAVASHARTAIFVHAGVVGWRGRAIVVPGRSMSGKTTLTRALVEARRRLLLGRVRRDRRGRAGTRLSAPARRATRRRPLRTGRAESSVGGSAARRCRSG